MLRYGRCSVVGVTCSVLFVFALIYLYKNTLAYIGYTDKGNRHLDISETHISRVVDESSEKGAYTSNAHKLLGIIEGNGGYNLQNKNGNRASGSGERYWSEYGQDKRVDDVLKQRRDGFFVEVGGYNGETSSNTLFFEKYRGWLGILIEADPTSYGVMVTKDRKCFMLNSCISNKHRAMDFTIADQYTSSNVSMTAEHRKRIPNVDSKAVLTVKCHSFHDIMAALGRNHVDYFSLDVEGAEIQILESIDWSKITIDVFSIETFQFRDEIVSFMRSKGYDTIGKFNFDDFFVKSQPRDTTGNGNPV